MKVLLTGASGFVGSHILECLLARNIPVAILLRQTSQLRFLESLLPKAEIRRGSITEPDTLAAALEGISHVIHCAGTTKALRVADYYASNQMGTRHLVQAINRRRGQIARLVHISSLAASRPATAEAPACEDDKSSPVSDYGRSKLLAEDAVRQECGAPFVILRPCAVYGPRDADFLVAFRSVRGRLLPVVRGGRQELSLVFVEDLAEAAVHSLTHPPVAGGVYNVAHPTAVTSRQLLDEIATQMGIRTVKLPVPAWGLRAICAIAESLSAIRGRPGILSRQKCAELLAPGWVCSTTRLERDTGFTVRTPLAVGVQRTLAWYRQAGWL